MRIFTHKPGFVLLPGFVTLGRRSEFNDHKALWSCESLQSGGTLSVKMAVLEKIVTISFKTKIKKGEVFSEEM